MNILVIQLKRLGDTLLVTPVLAALRARFPDARMVLVTDPLSASLEAMMPVDQCIVPARQGIRAWRSIWATNFDICLDFSGTDRSALATALSGASKRATYRRFQKKPFRRWIYNVWADSSVRDRHTADHHADLLLPLGISMDSGRIALSIPPGVEKEVAEKLKAVPDRFAVIHAGSARSEKFWMPDRWAMVVNHLEKRWGVASILTGTDSAEEKGQVAGIIRIAGAGADWTGSLSLPQLTAVLRRAVIFCGVDSAPLHLCDAMDTPCVGLFGPTNPYHWRPRFAPSRILRAGWDGEEFQPGQRGGGMESLSAERVIREVDHLMEEILSKDRFPGF